MKETKYYTVQSNHEFVDDDGYYRVTTESGNVYAKAVKEVKSKDILERSPAYFKYYVKIEPNKSLHNPYGSYSGVTGRVSFVDKICKSENSFMQVNQSVFDKYINYLKTQNAKWLTDAQRELR